MAKSDVDIASIEIDGDTQSRVDISEATVQDYCESLESGDEFPPVVLFHDGTSYWPGDGFHRILAHERLGRESVSAEVKKGTRRDALLYAVGANSKHGLRRTASDKRNAVRILLEDSTWSKKSTRWLAKTANVSTYLVDSVRKELEGEDEEPETRTCQRETALGDTVEYETPTHRPENSPPSDQSSACQEAESERIQFDSIGNPMGKTAVSVFAALQITGEIRLLYRRLLPLIDQLANSPGGLWVARQLQLVKQGDKELFRSQLLTDFFHEITQSEPYSAICPWCHHEHPGRYDKKCKACYGTGCCTRLSWEQAPEDYRQAVIESKEGQRLAS